MDPRPHPAKFHDNIIKVAADILDAEGIDGGELLFDPFGGTGKVFQLQDRFPHLGITALEIEPGWAAWDERITLGNALDNHFPDDHFDIVFTSPTYGNRMADSFNATVPSGRNTYTHKYGEELNPDNSGTLQWGPKYRDFHRDAWSETIRVLKPGGLFLLNIKNHIRAGKVQNVVGWHTDYLVTCGLIHVRDVKIPTPGNRQGQNGDVRIDHELICIFRKAGRSSWKR